MKSYRFRTVSVALVLILAFSFVLSACARRRRRRRLRLRLPPPSNLKPLRPLQPKRNQLLHHLQRCKRWSGSRHAAPWK